MISFGPFFVYDFNIRYAMLKSKYEKIDITYVMLKIESSKIDVTYRTSIFKHKDFDFLYATSKFTILEIDTTYAMSISDLHIMKTQLEVSKYNKIPDNRKF